MKVAELGISRLQERFEEFVGEGIRFVRELHGDAGSAFGAPLSSSVFDDSCLARRDEAGTVHGTVLVLDIGGTHTKVGICEFRGAEPSMWKMLFDRDNSEFRLTGTAASATVPLRRFAREIGGQTVPVIRGHGLQPQDITGVGIIWSNAIEARPLTTGGAAIRGVTGLVTSYRGGAAYRKGEWFVEELHDGFDLGATFLEELGAVGICPRVFVIGNDTVFTLKALPGAHSGVVASSGANATVIDAQGGVRNSELGARLTVKPPFLSEADGRLSDSVRIEDLIAGKGIGRFFTAQLELLRERGVNEVVPVLDSLIRNRRSFRAEDIAVLLRGECLSFESQGNFFSPEAHQILKEVARDVTMRGGYGAAALIALSLVGQQAPQEGFLVALDSSMARHLPGYLLKVREALDGLQGILGGRVVVELLTPEGFVTVPMRGAANAVSDFL